MGSFTKNLNLELTGTTPEDMSMTFSEWRQKINGETGSAFEIIDEAIGDIRKNFDYANRVHRYGVLWDKENAACTRLYDAVGMNAAAHKGSYNASLVNDFDNVYPWSERRLCNIDIATYKVLNENGEDVKGAIVAWEGEPDFSYTGANGAVMVYTPEYWMHAEEVDGGIEFVIADGVLPGYIHVPEIIGGRYMASSDGNGGVTSIAGVIPMVNTPMSTIHANAEAVGMTLDDIWTYTAENMLMVVEFANMNSQSAIGDGVSSLYRQNEADKPLTDITGANYVVAPIALANAAVVNAILDIGTSNGGNQVGKRIVTSIETYADNTNYKIIRFAGDPVDITTSQFLSIHGLSNVADEAIGSASGYIGTNGKANAYYRGRVAHGNIWRYVLGVYRETGTGHIWTARSRKDAAKYDALNTSVHVDTGCVLPYDASDKNLEGYVKTLHFLDNLPLAPFCASVGGNSSNPVGDYCWHPAKTAGNTILVCGGGASYGANDGRFFGFWDNSASYSNWYFGALPFLK